MQRCERHPCGRVQETERRLSYWFLRAHTGSVTAMKGRTFGCAGVVIDW